MRRGPDLGDGEDFYLRAWFVAYLRSRMTKHPTGQKVLILAVALSLAAVLLAQRAPGKQLVVNGRITNATVVQIDGRSYVDIDTVAQLMHGTFTVGPNQILLTVPSSTANSSPASEATAAPPGLSRNFATAAIATVAQIKEWTGAVAAMVTYGLADDASRAQADHDQVETSLAQASVAASTASDRDALRLLNNQVSNVAKWASGVTADRQAMNGGKTMDPNALQNDPALAKISSCGSFLNSMLASGSFADNSNCN